MAGYVQAAGSAYQKCTVFGPTGLLMNLEKALWAGCSVLAAAAVVCVRRCKGFRNCVRRAWETRQKRNPAREDMVKERRLVEGL